MFIGEGNVCQRNRRVRKKLHAWKFSDDTTNKDFQYIKGERCQCDKKPKLLQPRA